MDPVVAGLGGRMSRMSSSSDVTQNDNLAFIHPALANQVFSNGSLFQPIAPDLPSCPAHGKVSYLQKTCAGCLISFPTNSNLEQHASTSGHMAFSCTCGAQFARSYCLTRHINSKIGPSFPCELCDDKEFPRLDKLGDHLRRWHRLGVKAFDQYKSGCSSTISVSLANGETPQIPTKHSGEFYSTPPGSGSIGMLDGFPSALSTDMDACLSQSNASPHSLTGSDNWWYSQASQNTSYPP